MRINIKNLMTIITVFAVLAINLTIFLIMVDECLGKDMLPLAMFYILSEFLVINSILFLFFILMKLEDIAMGCMYSVGILLLIGIPGCLNHQQLPAFKAFITKQSSQTKTYEPNRINENRR